MKGTTYFGVCLAAVTLAVAGCGDDSDDDSDDGTDSAAAGEDAGEDAAGEETGGEDAGGDAAGEGATAGGSVELVTPTDGAEVTNPFEVEMATDDVEIAEGGMHFHLIVDAGCVDPGEPIPTTEEDERYRHYGDGSDGDDIELEAGDHELCLQVGDVAHIAQDMTDEATVTVTD